MTKLRPLAPSKPSFGRTPARLWLLAGLAAATLHSHAQALPAAALPVYSLDSRNGVVGSTYIPLDDWTYDALDRLQALGFADTAFLGIRPWTRYTVLNILAETASKLEDAPADADSTAQAREIYLALERELQPRGELEASYLRPHSTVDSVYVRALGIARTPLRDSFHLGQTLVNDYARPYQAGFDPVAGFSTRSEAGRFSLYVRGEFQHASAAPGYSPALTAQLSNIDVIPLASNPVQSTIPSSPLPATNAFRILEANASVRLGNHQVSFGKSDHWLGPAKGGAFSYGNNAENIYAFQVDRTEYLKIPGVSSIIGPLRYMLMFGSLKGHTDPNAPWFHEEKISLKPTENLELGFSRSVIFGGRGHAPINLHTFYESYFNFSNVSLAQKLSKNDPGARFSSFDFSYRLPFVRNWLTLYTDSFIHDDTSPIDAPRHAAIRPGLYLSRLPRAPRLDLRVEAADTDPDTGRSIQGAYLFAEFIQRQGYTNKGFLLGDAIGRESKGGQAWLTYHLSPAEQVQLSYRNAKAPQDFIPGGTTQNLVSLAAVKRLRPNLEARGFVQYERWAAPIYQPGQHTDVTASGQLTWYMPFDH